MKFLWKNIGTRVWMLVTSIVMLIFISASIVATQWTYIYRTINIVLGGERAIVKAGDTLYYTPDYTSKKDVLEAARDFNITLEEEGIILLKNDNNALPLAKNSKISVFGKNSINMVYGGTGSGGANSDYKIDLYNSLSEAGFKTNPTLKSFYDNNSQSGGGRPANPVIGETVAGFATGETPVSGYSSVRGSYSEYNAAAVVVISRIGGEGFDLPRTMKTSYEAGAGKISGAKSETDHYLQLDQNESDLLKEVYAHFAKVVLLLNTPTPMELGFVNDTNDELYSQNLKAVLWVGFPGSTGAMAIGSVLNGEINPSGRTTGIYAKDFTLDPTWYNFGNNNKSDGHQLLIDNNGTMEKQAYFYVEYEEGIYVGYRYYETRGFTEGGTWYKDSVVFPFGYGLSYTDFDWTITPKTAVNSIISENDVLEFDVKVKNSGDVKGKEVVQLYYTAPYTDNGIEKAHVVLGDFAKTDLINRNDDDTVTLKIKVSDLKSYDYNDANKNGHKGYEIEKGKYQIKIARNSHDIEQVFEYEVANDIKITQNDAKNYNVENRFDDVSGHIQKYLSRSDWENTFPTTPIQTDHIVDKDFISSLSANAYIGGDSTDKPWYSSNKPNQSSNEIDKKDITVTLRDLIEKSYDDPLWDDLLNQLTVEQMATMIGSGAFETLGILNIGKPLTRDPDGPSGFTNFMALATIAPVYDTCFYVAECVVGATWNIELAEEMGIMVGNEALIGNERGDKLPYSGWYAPAVNIHRSPFSGRNWEYYGEDGIHSGKMAAAVVKGAKEKGVYTYVKHFALNDQETDRDNNGLITWASEQSMREIYFKPFELAVTEGKTTAMMSSFNRIGTVWAGGHYDLLTEVLRNEWGFKGMVITDFAVNRYLNADQMIRAGGDLALSQGGKIPSLTNSSATQISSIRQAAKNILYTVANSNAMNAEITGYRLPTWVVLLIWFDVALLAGFGTWGFFAIRKAKRKTKIKAE